MIFYCKYKVNIVKKCVVVIKKFLKICVSIILGLAVVQIIRFAAETHAFDTSELKKAAGNYLQKSECNIENCVLVHKKNGISTFPFVFGNRLYLYDIEQKKHKLVADTWLPFTEIGTLITSGDDKVYYNFLVWEGSSIGGDVYCTDLKTGETKKVPEPAADTMYYGCSVYDGKIYYWKEGIGEEFREYEEYGIFFAADLASGEEEVFVDGEVQYFKVLGNTMYCCNRQDGKLHAVNLDTGEKRSYELGRKEVDCFIQGEGKEVFLDVYSAANPDDEVSWELVRLNPEEGVKTVEDGQPEEGIAHYRDGAIYTEDEFCIYKYCMKTWEKETIIDIREEMPFLNKEEYKSNVWSEISYCDDYIAMEVCYHSDKGGGDQSELLVYDYNGELVHRERLC